MGLSITQVGRVIIPVSDSDRALAFYTEKLGFEKRMDVPMGEGYRWIEVAPKGQQTSIALAPPPPDGGSPIGVETGVSLSTTDVDGDHAALKAAGIDIDDVMRWGDPVPPMFSFRDPDGNTLRIVETPAQ